MLAQLRDMARGKERRYLSHNPVGAAMIVALLIALAGTAFTGRLIADPARVALHEVFANLLLLLAALHGWCWRRTGTTRTSPAP